MSAKSANVFGTFLETVDKRPSPSSNYLVSLADGKCIMARDLVDVGRLLAQFPTAKVARSESADSSFVSSASEPGGAPGDDELVALLKALADLDGATAVVELALATKSNLKKMIDLLRDAEYAGLVRVDGEQTNDRRVSLTPAGKKLLATVA